MGGKNSGRKVAYFKEAGDLNLYENMISSECDFLQARDRLRRFKDKKFSVFTLDDGSLLITRVK